MENTNSTPCVSVVIPVYNASAHLGECLDSIVSQTLGDIEIICVDDGSSDDSWEILERYAEEDPRIRILSQNHQYAGVARNLGMAHARGTYLVFWDSDDYFMPEALERMYQQCERDRADICICGARQQYDDLGYSVHSNTYVNSRMIPDTVPFCRSDIPETILNVTAAVAWNKMFRREFVEGEELRFQYLRNGNDLFFVENALCVASAITVVEEDLVVYRKSQTTGLVATLSETPLNPLKAWVATARSLRKRRAFPERSFANKALSSIVNLLYQMSTYEALDKTLAYLQSGALDELGIVDREEGYYYNELYGMLVPHLAHGRAEELAATLSSVAYRQRLRALARKRHADELHADKVARLQAKAAARKDKIGRLKDKVERLQETADARKDKIERLEDRAERLQETADARKDKIERLNERVAHQSEVLDKRNKRIEELEDVVARLRDQNDRLREERKAITESKSYRFAQAVSKPAKALKR